MMGFLSRGRSKFDINRGFGAKEGGEDDVRKRCVFAALHHYRVRDNAIHPNL